MLVNAMSTATALQWVIDDFVNGVTQSRMLPYI